MKKSTKIIATIGPASDSVEVISKLHESGMNVARLNFSHGNYDYFEKAIKNIREVSEDIAILLDTKGPEIRTGAIKNGSMTLVDNKSIRATTQIVEGTDDILTINYPKLGTLSPGTRILIDDGLIEMQVVKKIGKDIILKIINGGILGSKKTVSIQGHALEVDFLSETDKKDIIFGIKHNVDFVAASFVRKEDDIVELKAFLKKHGSRAKIIAKIEHGDAVNNIAEIISQSDGVMVARGDLGVEISLEKVPRLQAEIILACNSVGKPVIVATQMLESMKDHPRPTRAEVSDVAQAIIQGVDAIMLSGETASGKYPILAVKMMARIAHEYDLHTVHNIDEVAFPLKDNLVASFVTKAVYLASITLHTKAILTPTESGFTARLVSRFKPRCPIYAVTRDRTVYRQLQLSWGVTPVYVADEYESLDEMTYRMVKILTETELIHPDDKIVITAGHKLNETGHTNLLEVYDVKNILQIFRNIKK